jgi:voltage-gated potassium channel
VALHDAALSTVVGEPLTAEGSFVRTLEVVLAAYSVVVFATLAGAFGAYYLEGRELASGGSGST